jgi:ribonuclease H2 subunit A
MLDRKKTSLNIISHNAAIELIKKALNENANIKEIYVDTVGPPDKYRELLQSNFPGIDITVKSKADDLFPVVSAASIAAKVTRDNIIQNWKFIEGKISNKLGSGYPGDPNTKKWLTKNCDKIFGFPNIVRFSWKTTTNILKDHSEVLKWENHNDEDDDKRNKKPTNQPEIMSVQKHEYFLKNKLILNFTLN